MIFEIIMSDIPVAISSPTKSDAFGSDNLRHFVYRYISRFSFIASLIFFGTDDFRVVGILAEGSKVVNVSMIPAAVNQSCVYNFHMNILSTYVAA